MSEHYIIGNESVRANAVKAITSLDLNKKWSVEIKQHRSSRSNAQNRLYWKWLGIIASDSGYNPEELHEIFKATFLGVYHVAFAGRKVPVAKSTADLNVNSFTNYLEKVEEAAKLLGVILPHPSDYSLAMYGEKT